MIDGIWWLVILLAVIAVLWFIAHLRGTKSNYKDKNHKLSATKSQANDSLQKTAVLIKQHFPDYRTSRRAKHLLIVKEGKKIAMITIDNSIAVGQRRLGDVPIINYHRVPNRAQLSTDLQDVY
ncbi:hypothetical protein [Psychrobacter sp. P2G3]|uniref:hypothetical protein n=1 Tax=unclassified Psychrobacter TaxID=196806 RepID=UPI00078BF2B2|nr:hypothetical protein [Psychrobacter sp. P2G3]AMN48943.1 hypothetical protein AK823_02745 [Psychrobacter sp. P2G3]